MGRSKKKKGKNECILCTFWSFHWMFLFRPNIVANGQFLFWWLFLMFISHHSSKREEFYASWLLLDDPKKYLILWYTRNNVSRIYMHSFLSEILIKDNKVHLALHAFREVYIRLICVIHIKQYPYSLSRRKLKHHERLRNTISIRTLAIIEMINWNRREHPFLYCAQLHANTTASKFWFLCIIHLLMITIFG